MERISQILPTVKCSDCGRNVNIRELGDHLCSKQPPLPPLPIMPQLKDQLNNQDNNTLLGKNSASPLYKDKPPSLSSSSQSSLYNSSSSNSSSSRLDDLMQSISDDIQFQTNQQQQLNECYACDQVILKHDKIRSFNNKQYHDDCLLCHLCRSPANHQHQEKFYCERDYYIVKSRMTCGSCDKMIHPSEAPIKTLGKFYHRGHIKCYHCYEPIYDSWKEHGGRVYCKKDFKGLFLPKCRKCNKTVEKQAISAMDGTLKGKWHRDCFGCQACHQPFPDNTFYVFDESPYCKYHYHRLNDSLCKVCDEPIEGPCAQTIENWRFHPGCFCCHVCRSAITDIYYMFEKRIYCESHINYWHNLRS